MASIHRQAGLSSAGRRSISSASTAAEGAGHGGGLIAASTPAQPLKGTSTASPRARRQVIDPRPKLFRSVALLGGLGPAAGTVDPPGRSDLDDESEKRGTANDPPAHRRTAEGGSGSTPLASEASGMRARI